MKNLINRVYDSIENRVDTATNYCVKRGWL